MDYLTNYKSLYKGKGCNHIYLEVTSDITILSKGEVKSSVCLKCKDLKIEKT